MKSVSILAVVAGLVCLAGHSVATESTTYYNTLADVVIAAIKADALGFYVDPYSMNNVTDTYKVGLISFVLKLLNGEIEGAQNMSRSGDVIVSTDSATNITNITFTLYFPELTYDADFVGKAPLVKASGETSGNITDITTTIVIQANSTNSSAVTAKVLKLNVDKIGDIEATVKSTNWFSTTVMNTMAKLIVLFFKRYVVELMETNMVQVLNNAMSTLSFNL